MRFCASGAQEGLSVTPLRAWRACSKGRLCAGALAAANSGRAVDRRKAARARSDHRGPLGLPDIPTVSEFLPGYEASVWVGLGAPETTPTEIVEKFNKEVNAGLADPKIKARLAYLGGNVLVHSPADFGKLIAQETEKWGKVIRAAGIKGE